MVPVDDALEYGQQLTAGFDTLLLELSSNLADGLPRGLPTSQRQAIRGHIDREVQRAREAVEEQR